MHEESKITEKPLDSAASRKNKDWTQGSIFKNLLTLAWPMVVSNSLNILGPTVDMIWVGKLGPDSVAAIGVAGTVVMLVNSFLMGVFTGMRSMIARFIGAGENKSAVHVAQQAFVVAAVLGIILAIIGILADRWVLGILGVSPKVLEIGSIYMRVNFIGMIAMSVRFTTDGIMQASGDTVNPMKLAVIFRFLHVCLSPVLIFGLWIFPEMGAVGSAVAMVFAQTLGSLLGLWILFSGRSRLRITFRNFKLDMGVIWRVITIGIPASVMAVQNQFGQLVMTAFVAGFGTSAVAAHSVCQRIDMCISMPLMGIGMSAGVLVGQNLGAHKPERAEKSGWIALLLVEAILVLLSILIYIWPGPLINVFSSDPGLVAIAAPYVRIASLGFAVYAFSMVLQSCISGAGDTVPPMVIGLLIIWAIQVPLGWLLSRTGLGVFGVRWAVVIGVALSTVAYVIYFRSGRWKRKRIS
jgi:putative MATE family efflux protein